MDEFAKRLRDLMSAKGITQAELVERSGVPKYAVSKYVNGKVLPKTGPLKALADALGVDALWLSGVQDEAERDSRIDQCVQLFLRLNEHDQNTVLGIMRMMLSSDTQA